MNPVKGYFSLVQYCPSRVRKELLNVGVVLFCPENHFIQVKTLDNINRILTFFVNYKAQHLRGMIDALESQIYIEKDQFKTIDDFTKFIDTRANNIVLTQIRSILVIDPVEDLKKLYLELVSY